MTERILSLTGGAQIQPNLRVKRKSRKLFIGRLSLFTFEKGIREGSRPAVEAEPSGTELTTKNRVRQLVDESAGFSKVSLQ